MHGAGDVKHAARPTAKYLQTREAHGRYHLRSVQPQRVFITEAHTLVYQQLKQYGTLVLMLKNHISHRVKNRSL